MKFALKSSFQLCKQQKLREIYIYFGFGGYNLGLLIILITSTKFHELRWHDTEHLENLHESYLICK